MTNDLIKRIISNSKPFISNSDVELELIYGENWKSAKEDYLYECYRRKEKLKTKFLGEPELNIEPRLNDNILSSNKFGETLEFFGGLSLNLNYWDCECDKDYIHTVNIKNCLKCNTNCEDQPNSRENEVILLIKR